MTLQIDPCISLRHAICIQGDAKDAQSERMTEKQQAELERYKRMKEAGTLSQLETEVALSAKAAEKS